MVAGQPLHDMTHGDLAKPTSNATFWELYDRP
jgi:hypothetical protein